MRAFFFVAAVLATSAPGALASCECGYKTNTKDLWQYSLLTDFSALSTQQLRASPDWDITSIVYLTQPYGINYTSANVNIVNTTLQLTASAKTDSSTTAIACGQIRTKRTDILHGSFRAQFSVSGGSGAIGALFFYANDTEETDIELLTRDDPHYVHFSNQPSSTSQMYMPNGLVRTTANTYRLDWLAGKTDFYVNNVLSNTLAQDVPKINGSVYMNMWSNGGPFPGGPPTTDATLAVSWIRLYFNTSDTLLAKTWLATCVQSKAKVCSVDANLLGHNSTSTTSNGSKVKHGRHSQRKEKEEGGEKLAQIAAWVTAAAAYVAF